MTSRTLQLSDIPTLSEASDERWPASDLVREVRVAVRRPSSRRSVLRTAVVGWSLTSLKIVSWLGPGASRAFAYGACTSEFLGADNDCNPPYPNGYGEGICCCANAEGPKYCTDNNWHRRDTSNPLPDVRHVYRRLCGPEYEVCGTLSYGKRNAWRWKKDGVVYRCSDGRTLVYYGSQLETQFLSICQGRL